MVQTKITDEVAQNISLETEEQEFKRYILSREYRKDGDQYLVGKHMETIGSEFMHGGYITASHVFYPGNEKYKQRLFQSYLIKKYYGVDETGISLSFSKLSNVVDSKSMLLKFKYVREKLKFGIFQDSNLNDSLLGCIAEKIASIPRVCLN